MMALALKPRLLLLDEPTAGMGDQETYDITRLIRRLHQDQKLTIVLIEHDMRVVFHLADRIMVLAEGAVLAEGTPAEIAADERGAGRLSGEGRMNVARGARACTPSTARATSCTAWASRCAKARSSPARPQRRRQDDDPAQPGRADPAARGRGAHLRAGDDDLAAVPRSPRSASATCRRAGASSPT